MLRCVWAGEFAAENSDSCFPEPAHREFGAMLERGSLLPPGQGGGVHSSLLIPTDSLISLLFRSSGMK